MHFLSIFKRYFVLILLANTGIFAMESCSDEEKELQQAKLELVIAFENENEAGIISGLKKTDVPLRNVLREAILHKKENVVKLLLKCGANVNEEFLTALEYGNFNIVKILAEAGADLLVFSKWNKFNILHWLCCSVSKDTQVIGEFILDQLHKKYGPLKIGELLQQVDKLGYDPFTFAIKHINAEIISVFLKYAAKPSCKARKMHLVFTTRHMIKKITKLPFSMSPQQTSLEIENCFKIIQMLSRSIKNTGELSKESKLTDFESCLDMVSQAMIKLERQGIYNKTLADTFDLLREHGALFLTEFPTVVSKKNPEEFYSALSTAYAKNRTNGKTSMFNLLKHRELTGKKK